LLKREEISWLALVDDLLLALLGPKPDYSKYGKKSAAHMYAWNDLYTAVHRKLTTLRSLFSYLQIYGYAGANPAHGKFVKAPPVPRDGKTVGLSPSDCRRLLEAPSSETPAGIRDRAILSVLAYSACRVGELVRLRVGDFRTSGEHRVLSILGKGGKERTVPLHLEAVERLAAWLATAQISDDRPGPLFRPACSPRGQGWDGFQDTHLTTRSVQLLLRKYARRLHLDPAVTVHSLRVTALTTARQRGSDIIDLQDFAGHADPRTTLTYIRTRDRLSEKGTGLRPGRNTTASSKTTCQPSYHDAPQKSWVARTVSCFQQCPMSPAESAPTTPGFLDCDVTRMHIFRAW